MTLGFERAGFDVLASVDSDPVHLAVHERNFPNSFALCADIGSVKIETLHSAIRKGWGLAHRDGDWDGHIDCVFGGPSCQGFSDMGARDVDDLRNDLIFSFLRIVKGLRPSTFVLENVPGILSGRYATILERFKKDAKKAGYLLRLDVSPVLDASNFGVPQIRKRVFMIGALEGTSLPALPVGNPGPTVGDALHGLPNVERFEYLLGTDRMRFSEPALQRMYSDSSRYVQRLKGRQGLEYRRISDSSWLSGCQRTVHQSYVVERFDLLAEGGVDVVSRTSRLRREGRARTLRAGSGRDHGSYTAPRPIHYQYPRVITVREAARLHSYPDWFDFHQAKWHALRQIGNSVPPEMAASVASEVKRALGFPDVKPTRSLALGSEDLLSLSILEAADYFELPRNELPPDVRSPYFVQTGRYLATD
jgi:DNA (cytosine-5)-methyltransferase 1